MKILVGLGNPGLRYRNTRHNIGFVVLSEIAKKYRVRIAKKSHRGLLGTGKAEGEKIIFFMPYTFMNLSGEAVSALLKAEKASPDDLLLICDDVDLCIGNMRLREKGSSGGHKGLKSIIEHIGTVDFPRLRIGIGRKEKPRDMVAFVLKPFNRDEKKALKNVIEDAKACVSMYIKEGPEKAMSEFNRRNEP